MGVKEKIERVTETLSLLEIESFRKAVKDAVHAKISPDVILLEGMTSGMEIIGEKYEGGEYFLTELVLAGHMMKEGVEMLKPLMSRENKKKVGKVLIGTVQGDLHDIGKNLVAHMFEGSGFDVYDLGVDVSSEKFIEKVKEVEPDILALSALLTTTMPKMSDVIQVLKKEGLRDKVKVLVGGRPLTQEYAEEIGADGYARGAIEAEKKGKELLKI